MDRKAIIVVAVSVILLVLWFPLVNKLYPPKAIPLITEPQPGSTNQPATNGPATNATIVKPPVVVTNGAVAAIIAKPNAPEQTAVLTNEWVRYTFTSHGGGLKQVELLKYPADVGCRAKDKENQKTAGYASLNTHALVPALALTGAAELLDTQPFAFTTTTNGLRVEKTLTNGLKLVHEFAVGTNYQLAAVVRIENTLATPLAVGAHEWVLGTATPMSLRDDGLLMGLMQSDGKLVQTVDQSWFANRTLGCFPGTPRTEFVSTGTNAAWGAVYNQFFTMTAVPQGGAPHLVARQVNLPEPTVAEKAAEPKANAKPFGYQAAFSYAPTILKPGEKLEHQLTLYAGPKEYNTIARLGHQLKLNLDEVMNFGTWFGWVAKALLLSMNGLAAWGLPYGWAIVVITIIIKLVFWPLTNASTKSMKRMAELQPQMKALQEKYKDDSRKMNLKLMEFMKENKVSPLGGCLPMLLQIPVFFGFYTMLQSAIELRGAQFLWACDLSQGDTVATLAGFPINPMPLLMGVTMVWQARITPPSPGMDPMQQKIMKYMPLMFMVFLYNFSAGLTLYWTVQNLLTIVQMKLTKTGTPVSNAVATTTKKK